jgi:hypothetical protein
MKPYASLLAIALPLALAGCTKPAQSVAIKPVANTSPQGAPAPTGAMKKTMATSPHYQMIGGFHVMPRR